MSCKIKLIIPLLKQIFNTCLFTFQKGTQVIKTCSKLFENNLKMNTVLIDAYLMKKKLLSLLKVLLMLLKSRGSCRRCDFWKNHNFKKTNIDGVQKNKFSGDWCNLYRNFLVSLPTAELVKSLSLVCQIKNISDSSSPK